MVEMSHELLAAQIELKRTAFGKWITQEVGMSKREAARCMRVAEMAAEVYGDRFVALEALSFTALQQLAERSVPASVRTEVLHRLEANELLRSAEVLKMARDATKAERARKKAENEEQRLAQLTPEQRAAEDTRRTGITADRSGPSQPNQDEVARVAADVIERFGADALASLAEQYGAAAGPALGLAVGLAIAQHQRQDEVIELPVSEIDCRESQDPDANGEDAVLNMAERIEGGDPVPSIIVARDHNGRYNLIGGHQTFQAYADVLQRPTVPVCIARPISVAIDAGDARSG